jgi:monomeric sarcosine oxidase
MIYDVIIIGAGVMGSATAYNLALKNKKVLILDQYRANNNMNASRDYSRHFGLDYGTDHFYTKLAVESLKLWKLLEKNSGKKLLYESGALLLGENNQDYAMKSYQTIKRLGHKVDLLSKDQMKKRFNQFEAGYGVFDPHGQVIDARKTTQTFINLAVKNGAKLQENSQVMKIGKGFVVLKSGEKIKGSNVVATCGAWTKKLLPAIPIKTTKQQIIYLEPQKLSRYQKQSFPMFAYLDKGFYGFPTHGIQAVKISSHLPGKIVDPDDMGERKVDEGFIKKCRQFLRQYIPNLVTAKLVEGKVCLYDTTPDKDFIIDRLKEGIFVGVFSGHGFKFAPLVGKIMADLVIKGKTKHPINRFRLSRFKGSKYG